MAGNYDVVVLKLCMKFSGFLAVSFESYPSATCLTSYTVMTHFNVDVMIRYLVSTFYTDKENLQRGVIRYM